MRIIDRYVIRQVLMPFGIGLLVFTFLLIIPLIIDQAETFIAKGVPIPVVIQLMATLLPGTLALTIPMSLLLGLLVAFGRLSADREFVAMQACGVSLTRLMRPVGLVSVFCWAATSYMLIVGMPAGNQMFREITFRIAAERAEGEVKAGVFFTAFPDLVLYVREVPKTGGWNGVFMIDSRPGQPQTVYLARRGHVFINRDKRTVDMVLEDGSYHVADPNGEYRVSQFGRVVSSIDPARVFPREGPEKGANEMTIAELRAQMVELRKSNISTHNQEIAIQRKFSIPLACFVFAMLGLALGATNRRDGSLGSFVLGVVVVFIYYIPLYLGPQLAKGALISPALAAWLPDIVIGAGAVAILVWRDRVADQTLRMPLPAFLRIDGATSGTPRRRRVAFRLPVLTILDRYIASTYGRVLGVSAIGMAAIFYISTFIDRSDKVFKGAATWEMLARFFWYSTPQYIYYIIPLAVLLGAVVTIGTLTKSSELIVMKACGISLYRLAMPMVACAVVAGGILFALEQTILGASNQEAETLRLTMNGSAPGKDMLTRRWLMGRNGTIYQYAFYDPNAHQMTAVDMFEFTRGMERLTRRTFAERAVFTTAVENVDTAEWRMERGWTREFDKAGAPTDGAFTSFSERPVRMESAEYYSTKEPEPKFMTYTQLRDYISRLQLTGFDVTEQQVALARKLAFPFVTLVMTLIAIPFGVTTGRSGAMAGIGVGIALAVTYWTAISIFAALGSGGVLPPTLAVWAPNLLFGAAAAYMLLTVRT